MVHSNVKLEPHLIVRLKLCLCPARTICKHRSVFESAPPAVRFGQTQNRAFLQTRSSQPPESCSITNRSIINERYYWGEGVRVSFRYLCFSCFAVYLQNDSDPLTYWLLTAWNTRTHTHTVSRWLELQGSEESSQYLKKWYQSEKEPAGVFSSLLFAILNLFWFYNINSGFRPGPLIWNVCFLFLHVSAQDYFILFIAVIFKQILDPDENMLFYCGPAGGTPQAAVPESLTSCWGLHGRCVRGQSADLKPPEERWRSAHLPLLLPPLPALLLLSLAPPAVKQKNLHVAGELHTEKLQHVTFCHSFTFVFLLMKSAAACGRASSNRASYGRAGLWTSVSVVRERGEKQSETEQAGWWIALPERSGSRRGVEVWRSSWVVTSGVKQEVSSAVEHSPV